MSGKELPQPPLPRDRVRHLPAVSLRPDLELRPGPGGWHLHEVPEWVAAWTDGTPETLEGRPLPAGLERLGLALAAVAAEVDRSGGTVDDYCVEFRDAGGGERAVLLRAWRPEWGGRRVLARLHEVSLTLPPSPEAEEGPFHGLVGSAPTMLELARRIRAYGPVRTPVLVTGETGTGKELVARALHAEAAGRPGAFIALNCAAVTAELVESELFGHERGAFTGAVTRHRGRFERASGGTLFLDEVGEMPASAQAKLLRVLELGVVELVGGEEEIRVDVRVVAATNAPLEEAVAAGRFRVDLYHRLAVLRLHVPPLRERPGDIPLLVEHFLAELGRRHGRRVVRLTDQAMQVLLSYSWPGNVRELRNTIERIIIETRGSVIGWRALEEWIRERAVLAAAGRLLPGPPQAIPLPLRRPGPPGREEIRRALASTDGNIAAAARLLGIHRGTLYRHLRRLGLRGASPGDAGDGGATGMRQGDSIS